MKRFDHIVGSPVGPIYLAADDIGLSELLILHEGRKREVEADNAAHFREVISQLEEYFAGKRTDFDVKLSLHGTPFQQRVWAALRQIPYGTTQSYGELAKSLGKPNAFRAVGAANGRNPVSIIVPCHRVIGADGTLTGFGGGLGNKQRLLELEGALPCSTPLFA